MDLGAVFLSALAAATLLPGGSEAVLAWADRSGTASDLVLLAVATAGNTLGGMTSWLIGRLLPEGRKLDEKAVARLRRYGAPVLLLSWVPIVGDPLCVAAGWIRLGWLSSLLYMAIGKGARYAVLLWLL